MIDMRSFMITQSAWKKTATISFAPHEALLEAENGGYCRWEPHAQCMLGVYSIIIHVKWESKYTLV